MTRRPVFRRAKFVRSRGDAGPRVPARPARTWKLERDIERIRAEFPTLARGVYLISNSLGAVPRSARTELLSFYERWEREGVTAWETAWWDLGVQVGNLAAEVIGAPPDSVTMTGNATQAHWAALSTRFLPRGRGRRRRVVLSDQDFPSILYAVRAVSGAMGWEPVVVSCRGAVFDSGPLIDAIDERTLFVATSHVCFKTGFIQDVREICDRARRRGALSVIDGYHAPGAIPVDVTVLGADFYVGGCLKWLCGGPGTAFLYVRPETARRERPALTGWAAHRRPFRFSLDMDFASGSRGFQNGTPPVPCLYTARAGLEALRRVGAGQVRAKSLMLTELVMARAGERGFPLFSPGEKLRRAGHVSFHVPHGLAVKLALETRGVKTDFRRGGPGEPDMLRVGPHFYNTSEEVEALFRELDDILRRRAYRPFSKARGIIT